MANKIIIDATNATLGRLASYAAKQALQGNEIIIVNSERAIVTGRKKNILEHYHQRISRGGTAQRGPYFSRTPERIMKRTIRGMLPDYREGRGKLALKRIKCFSGMPAEYEKEKMIKAGKEKHTTYLNIKQISKRI